MNISLEVRLVLPAFLSWYRLNHDRVPANDDSLLPRGQGVWLDRLEMHNAERVARIYLRSLERSEE